jgi:hypothetical protein
MYKSRMDLVVELNRRWSLGKCRLDKRGLEVMGRRELGMIEIQGLEEKFVWKAGWPRKSRLMSTSQERRSQVAMLVCETVLRLM